MTELLTRPAAARDRASAVRPSAGASVWWRGVLAASWAVALGVASLVVIVLVAWAADSRAGASAGQAIRTALQIWLAAHKTPLHVPGGTVAVAPLLLTLALGFLVARAAAVLARGQEVTEPIGVGVVALAVGLPYAGLTAFVAAAARSPAVSPAPVPALAAGLVVGIVAAGWGAARGAGLVGQMWRRMPGSLRLPLGAGGLAVGVFLAVSTVLLLAGLALHLPGFVDGIDSLGGGPVAAIALVVLDLALLPNAAVFALGYLAGPGFAVGAGTSVTLSSAQVSTLPALPLLVALPRRPASFVVVLVAVVALVGAGVAAAWLISREGEPLLRSTAYAGAAGLAAGVIAALLAAVAGGPAGPGEMAVLGCSPWQVGVMLGLEVAVVAAGATGVLTWRRGR